jgi:hypothetical protein
MDNHVFHIVDPSLESFRLLYTFEKPPANIPLYSISINNWRCVTLKAKINDIICIKTHLTKIYRKVQ